MSHTLPVTLYQGATRHVEYIHYPDGQQSCQLDLAYFNDVKLPIVINCSIRNFHELEQLLCLVAAFHKNDFVIEQINFVYLFGMRSDRAFAPGQPNYFRDVLAPIINKLPGELTVFSPHGTLAQTYLRQVSLYEPKAVVKLLYTEAGYEDKYIELAGDKSAYESFAWGGYGYFHKVRNTDGSIASMTLRDKQGELIARPDYEWDAEKPFIIIDDLCDGGATFIAAGNILKTLFPDRKRYLFVAHGMFSKGFDHLLEVFDGIITTNSYQTWTDIDDEPRITVLEVIKPQWSAEELGEEVLDDTARSLNDAP